RLLGVAFAGIAALTVAGCGGPPTGSVGAYSPEAAAAAATKNYDTNKNGKLDAPQLKKSPRLADNLAGNDTNNHQSTDAREIAARITSYTTSGTRLRDISYRVVRRGAPVAGVNVTLKPEEFMLGAIKPATGVTTETGDALLQTEGQPFPGAQVGFYQIILSQ